MRILHLVEGAILSASIMAMAVMTIANVLARNLLDHNIAATQELNQFLIVVVCFVGLAYASRKGRHIRMTAIYDMLPDRPRKGVMVFIAATTSILLFILAWVALDYTWSVDRVSPVLGVPLFAIYLVAPLGLLLAGIEYALAVVENLTREGVYVSVDHPDGYHSIEESQEI